MQIIDFQTSSIRPTNLNNKDKQLTQKYRAYRHKLLIWVSHLMAAISKHYQILIKFSMRTCLRPKILWREWRMNALLSDYLLLYIICQEYLLLINIITYNVRLQSTRFFSVCSNAVLNLEQNFTIKPIDEHR